jgi:tetratricopeptide (TPR) repeat protein
MECNLLMVSCTYRAWLFLFIFTGTGWAHESPNSAIDKLSHIMATSGPTPELLVERAYEYRSIGELHLAEMDLKFSIYKSPDYDAAYVALAKLYLHDKKPEKALDAVIKGAHYTLDNGVEAHLNALAAECYERMGNTEKALNAISKALLYSDTELNWILTKCRVLKTLDRHKERVQISRKAFKANGAVVLGIELIESLTDAHAYDECLELINGYIAKRRFKAEWYLRRAEVYRAMGDLSRMQADGNLAVVELLGRIESIKPAMHLYEDLLRAYTLVGNEKGVEEIKLKIIELKKSLIAQQ